MANIAPDSDNTPVLAELRDVQRQVQEAQTRLDGAAWSLADLIQRLESS